jgi:hypothetical protein
MIQRGAGITSALPVYKLQVSGRSVWDRYCRLAQGNLVPVPVQRSVRLMTLYHLALHVHLLGNLFHLPLYFELDCSLFLIVSSFVILFQLFARKKKYALLKKEK